jgi:hypothetical protein
MVRVTTGIVWIKLQKAFWARDPCTIAFVAVPARALAARQSPHSDAAFDPVENPLNVLPQLGHVDMLEAFRSSVCSIHWKAKKPVTS